MNVDVFLRQYGLALNPQQQKAVECTEGQTLLLAVPGSGKTTVIVARLGYLIFGCGVKPAQILTLSYNVSAVADLKQRFAAQFEFAAEQAPEFRTINGFCAQVLLAYCRMTGGTPFRLMDTEGESTRLLRQTFRELTDTFPSDLQLRELQRALSYARNRILKESEITELRTDTVEVSALLQAYTAKKTKLHVMDYDDQLEFAYRALKKYPELLARYRRQFRYIQVDEAQDASLLQHEIIRLLVDKNTSLLMVGDEDQSIYGFRAAYPDALFSFRTYYPNGELLTLEQNYRSTGAIVNAANRLIRFNRNRHEKHMFTERVQGEAVQRILLRSRAAQYKWLADLAAGCRTQTAVLFRNNDSALPLIDLLTARGIPFFCREHDALYLSQPIIFALCDGLRFALNPCDEDLFRSLYYKFGLPISRAMMEDTVALHRSAPHTPLLLLLADHALAPDAVCARIRTLQRHLARAARMNTYDALQLLRSDTALGGDNERHVIDPLRFDALMALAAQNPEPKRFLNRLDELHAIITQGCGTPNALFVLSTIHSAKGLEYDRVILMDVWDGILPSADRDERGRITAAERLEEERRLFYVGVTRARDRLALLEYGAKADDLRAPRFLRELFGLVEPSVSEIVPKPVDVPYPPNTRVRHRLFGCGTVLDCNRTVVTVLFDTPRCERRLDLAICRKDGLLTISDSN